MKKKNKRFKHHYLSLVEVLLVAAIIAILASFLLPSLGKSRRTARSVICVSNLKQAGVALQLYTGDNELRFPNDDSFSSRTWLGKKGDNWPYKVALTKRPLNQYLGYTDEKITDIPVAKCPIIVPDYNKTTYNQRGSYYFGNMNKFEDPNGLYNKSNANSYKTVQIYNNSLMIALAGKGAHNYTRDANDNGGWSNNSHNQKQPTFSFLYTDGHVRIIKAELGEGSTGPKTRINWYNEP